MREEVRVAERVLQILQDGAFTSTYKQAVLVGLLDLCLELTRREGVPPSSVTTRQLAEKVVELFWPQTRPWGDASTVLSQSAGTRSGAGGARIVRYVNEVRTGLETRRGTTVTVDRARLEDPAACERLVRQVEWALIEMPLPKLQRVGGESTRWLYEISWDDGRDAPRKGEVSAYQKGRPSSFDNVIRFRPGVAEAFQLMHGILRPFILQHWAAKVATLNRLPEGRLQEFLFGADRTGLTHLTGPLLDLQHGDCFYCGRGVRKEPEVDHFIPWARHPDNGIHTLVVAHRACNGSKLDHLAAARHVEHWRERSGTCGEALEQISEELHGESSQERILGVARAIYLHLPAESRLWVSRGEFASVNRAELGRLL